MYRNHLFILAILIALTLSACGLYTSVTPKPTSTLVFVPSATVNPCQLPGHPANCTAAMLTPGPSRTPAASRINAQVVTVTGKVTGVNVLPDKQSVRLVIKPDVPGQLSDITISDWSKASVYFYWEGFQTPTPVANGVEVVARNALNHQITLGYYATTPPVVAMVSIHKQKGDPQK